MTMSCEIGIALMLVVIIGSGISEWLAFRNLERQRKQIMEELENFKGKFIK